MNIVSLLILDYYDGITSAIGLTADDFFVEFVLLSREWIDDSEADDGKESFTFRFKAYADSIEMKNEFAKVVGLNNSRIASIDDADIANLIKHIQAKFQVAKPRSCKLFRLQLGCNIGCDGKPPEYELD